MGQSTTKQRGRTRAKKDKLRTLTETLTEIIPSDIYCTARGPKLRAACKCGKSLEKPHVKQKPGLEKKT